MVTGNISGGKALRQSQHESSQHGSGNRAYAAKHSCSEGLDACNKTDEEIDLADM